MTPERNRQIEQVAERAASLAPARRAAYLAEACAGDEALRREVESRVNASSPAPRADASSPAPRVNASSPASPASRAGRASKGASKGASGRASKGASKGASGGGASRSASRARAGAGETRRGSKKGSTKAPPEVVPGRTTLGAYRVLEKIGAGGMGTVYLAKDARLGRRVAVKVLPAHFARDEGLVRRFEQEARAASALNHPNIITVHEIGEHGGRLFIVTEFVEGRTLRERMWEGRFTAAAALDVCAQVAGALAKAHASGIVHRDVKPENVMLDAEGHVKVLDFGIAKQVAAPPQVDTEAPTEARVDTASGVVLGTTAYMSPEQVRGQELDGRSDVWSLGVVLYELLAGRPPFEEKNFGDLVVSILHGEPPPLASLADGPVSEVEPLVLRALSKGRDARFQTAKEFQAELRRVRRLLELRAEVAADERRDTVPAIAPPAAAAVAAAPPAPAPRQTSEQRKQLTVLFADFAGLAALTEGADAEDVSELMSALWPLVDGVVSERGGEVTKHVGETFVALWGAEAAREDDPEQAVRAALDMQRAVAELVAARWPHDAPADPRDAAPPDSRAAARDSLWTRATRLWTRATRLWTRGARPRTRRPRPAARRTAGAARRA